ncbi:MAG: EAL domain-containing protein [Methylotenera sp.]|uniref:EAL domain-containing protein n=1 Tax=Methylotenera sp. TaxID=2051956 RepID=UPI00271D43AE|nr:EAL domain-containing protein [Methylotenera sp.]MDO9204415.1 EAL domain-containing protein [Methylotenera sp.]MDO9392828.1 EAL domain-containing protein [Methylotenera sp.]MDP1521980.1 EAL domain-containing protein [Methylotenera sp.]MDP2072200.1 EAL domain-containing protein [Methylotenera sp.]MDP2231028.1 EAL domain-containing protein [Methylotenera sp.]
MSNFATPVIHMRSKTESPPCVGCKNSIELDFDFEYAFQPIVDNNTKTIFAHEALIRGPNGEAAYTVLSKVNNDNTYRFDQACRVKAVKTAAELNLKGMLSINFMPNAVYRPELCIRTTLEAAKKYNFPANNIIFEFTEQEIVEDTKHLLNIVSEYKKLGFKTALDDFGAGYAGLNLLANFQPDIIKIDMNLIRNVDISKSRQTIIKAVTRMCEELNVIVLAEGVETIAERDVLLSFGINLFQGYLFCKPAFKAVGIVEPTSWC